jgi:hypothetical protein
MTIPYAAPTTALRRARRSLRSFAALAASRSASWTISRSTKCCSSSRTAGGKCNYTLRLRVGADVSEGAAAASVSNTSMRRCVRGTSPSTASCAIGSRGRSPAYPARRSAVVELKTKKVRQSRVNYRPPHHLHLTRCHEKTRLWLFGRPFQLSNETAIM